MTVETHTPENLWGFDYPVADVKATVKSGEDAAQYQLMAWDTTNFKLIAHPGTAAAKTAGILVKALDTTADIEGNIYTSIAIKEAAVIFPSAADTHDKRTMLLAGTALHIVKTQAGV